jgi:hypothetical protein
VVLVALFLRVLFAFFRDIFAFDDLVFRLHIVHGMRLEFFGADIHPDEHAPGCEQGGSSDTDRRSVWQIFRAAMDELEHADQALDRQGHDNHDQEARQEAAHAGRRADVGFALDFFFQHGLAKTERGNGDGQHADAFEDEVETFARNGVGGRAEGRPDFDASQHDKADAAGEEQDDDEHVTEFEVKAELAMFRRGWVWTLCDSGWWAWARSRSRLSYLLPRRVWLHSFDN